MHGAVEKIRNAKRLTARHRDVHAALEVAVARRAGLDGRARQHDEIGDLAPLQRQLQDALLFDHLRDARAAHVDERRRRLDGHRFGEVAYAEHDVDRRRRRHLQHDPRLCVGPEALKRGFQPIRTNRQVGHQIVAVSIGDNGAGEPGLRLGHRDSHAGKHRAAFVADDAAQFRGGLRRSERSRQQHGEQAGECSSQCAHVNILSNDTKGTKKRKVLNRDDRDSTNPYEARRAVEPSWFKKPS